MPTAPKAPQRRSGAPFAGRPSGTGGHARGERPTYRRSSGSAVKSGAATEHGRYFVESLGRGLGLLDSFLAGPAQLTLVELADRIGLTKATTFRLLQTLQEAGYLRQDAASKRYSLTLKALDLQEASLAALDYLQLVQPCIEGLNAEIGEAVNVAVLEGTDVRYVARVAGKSLLSVNLHVGSKLPAHATSMGKVLLAALPDRDVRKLYSGQTLDVFTPATIRSLERLCADLALVRRRGYAIADEELERGLRSAAVPLHGRGNEVVAALNIATSTARVSRARLIEELVPQLVKTAAMISNRIALSGADLPRA
jgi:IclR family pca regulon transcriptional regulator